jgi:Pyruvate/2-oxoacid:ferredoxin oxidoreductase gamma subunit
LLGALATAERFPIKTESLREALKELVPAKHVEANLKAFTLGYEYVKQKAKPF